MSVTKDGVMAAISQAPGFTIPMDSSNQVSSKGGFAENMMKGAGAGATIGSIVPGIGTAVGAIGGAVGGAAQTLLGLIMQRRAMKSKPYDVDPDVSAFLSDIRMKRKNLSYSGAGTAQGENLVKQNSAAILDKIASTGVGNTGQVAAGMGVVQANANEGINSILAAAQNNDNVLMGVEDQVLNRMSQRKLDLGMYDHLSKLAFSSQMMNAGMDNAGNTNTGVSDFFKDLFNKNAVLNNG